MTLPSYFRTSGYLPDNQITTKSGMNIDLAKMPSFLRTLLVTDGTVTKSLEAWFWEVINVEALSNELENLEDTINGLEVGSGDQVLRREVYLRGENSHQIYAYANSIVSLKHLPDEIGRSLIKSEIGIGELLREKDVETYRDIFDINYFESKQNNNSPLAALLGDIISRSYRIRVNRVPTIIVNEYFPVELFK